MEQVNIMQIREHDIFAMYSDAMHRVTAVMPRPDIRKTVGMNGKPITIRHQEPVIAQCVTEPNSVHLSTSRGVWCLNRETMVYRESDTVQS